MSLSAHMFTVSDSQVYMTVVWFESRRTGHVVLVCDCSPDVVVFGSVNTVLWCVPLSPSSPNSGFDGNVNSQKFPPLRLQCPVQ